MASFQGETKRKLGTIIRTSRSCLVLHSNFTYLSLKTLFFSVSVDGALLLGTHPLPPVHSNPTPPPASRLCARCLCHHVGRQRV